MKLRFFLTLLIVFGVGTISHIQAQVSVDSLFARVVSEIDSTSLETRLDVLKTFMQDNGDYAPAYHEMAKLYLAQGTPQSRMNAKRSLQEAIRLDNGNVAYQITQGDLLWVQGFRSNAEAQFQKIYNTYPDNAKAAYMIGLQAVKQFYRYENMGKAHHYLAQEDLERAISHLNQSIRLNPRFQDSYYLLGILYYDQNQPDKLVKLSTQLLLQYPNNKDALLFKGLGLQKQELFEEAYESYELALSKMDTEERALIESVDWVVDEDEQSLFKRADKDSTLI